MTSVSAGHIKYAVSMKYEVPHPVRKRDIGSTRTIALTKNYFHGGGGGSVPN